MRGTGSEFPWGGGSGTIRRENTNKASKAERRKQATLDFRGLVIAWLKDSARHHPTSKAYSGGISETFQPPPTALTSRTLAVIRRVKIFTAVTLFESATVCAVVTSR